MMNPPTAGRGARSIRCRHHDHPDRASVVECRIPDVAWISGSGEWALIAWCRIPTVTLWDTRDEADEAKRLIDATGCGGNCGRVHEIARVRLPDRDEAMTGTDPLYARLIEAAEVVEQLDRGTRIQLALALGGALDRSYGENPQPRLQPSNRSHHTDDRPSTSTSYLRPQVEGSVDPEDPEAGGRPEPVHHTHPPAEPALPNGSPRQPTGGSQTDGAHHG